MPTVRNTDCAITDHLTSLRTRHDGPNVETSGTVTSRHGIVEVWAHRFRHHEFSMLWAARDGRLYQRRLDRFYSKRYLVTLAKRFAAEVAADA